MAQWLEPEKSIQSASLWNIGCDVVNQLNNPREW